MITLEIPRVPVSPNYLRGKHWRYRHKNSTVWNQEIYYAVHQARVHRDPPYEHAKVTIHRRSKGELDPDNLVACVKPVIDALRYAKVLVDDSPAHLKLEVTQSCSHKLPPQTLIKIEPINV